MENFEYVGTERKILKMETNRCEKDNLEFWNYQDSEVMEKLNDFSIALFSANYWLSRNFEK